MTAPRVLLFSLLSVCLVPANVRGEGVVHLQPEAGESGLVLIQRGRTLEATAPGRAPVTARLREGEVLTAVAETDDGWLAAGIRTRRERVALVLLAWDGVVLRRLPAPAAGGAHGVRPVPMVADGRLEGLVWLEGAEIGRLDVVAADWTGGEWLAPETVRRAAAGSQTGLAGAVLEDGDWLLVWSAFDGSDDELLWSRREGASWSAPAALHPGNAVPDVTPALAPDGGGALAVWSRFDGAAYRVFAARFERGRWSTPRPAGEPGSLYPALLRRAGALTLLMRRVEPDGWEVRQLDGSGRARSSAFVAATRGSRPVLAASSRREITVAWPGLGAEARAAWSVVP